MIPSSLGKDTSSKLKFSECHGSQDLRKLKGTGGITGKTATKRGTKVKEQRSSGNESDKTNLQNMKSGEDTADKAEASPAEYRRSAGKENEVKVSEKSSKDPKSGGQQGHLGTWEDRGIIDEVILQHRYNLRDQSKNMKMPNLHFISDIYTVPKITLIHPEHDDVTGESNYQVREVEIHELLKRRSSDPNKTIISVVYGAAGTGKTALIQKIIHDWAMGMKYEEFRFVLHFKIQNLNAIKGRITLSRLIADAYPYLENYMGKLWREPNRLLFIFDDLSQLHRSIMFSDNERSNDPRHSCTGAESNCLVNDILRCLLQGKFLRGCSVLITARLWKQETLRHVTIDSTFQVIGFTSEKVREYFYRYQRYDQNANETVQLIERNDILRNLRSNPLFCVTLGSSLESHQPQRNEKTSMAFINHTQVFLDFISHLLEACGYDDNTTQKCLLEIGELAYKGITRGTLSFSFEAGTVGDLSTCPDNFLSAFMIQIQNRQSSDVVYEFTHSVVRDFLAALAKIINTPKSRLINILDETFMDPDRRLKIFSLFLVGLSSRKSTHRLKFLLGSVPDEVTSWISDCLTQSVKRRLTNVAGDFSKRTLLHTLYCLLEFEDNQIMTEVLTPITIKLNQLLLTSPDYAVLSRTLIYSEEIKELDLSSSLAEPEEIQKLEHLLHRCVILRLNQNNLQDSGVKGLFNILEKTDCKVETLELKSNGFTDDCLCALFSMLSINRSLTLLNLSNYSQDGEHANQFTHETLQHHVDNYAQQKNIRWLRYEHIGRDTNVLILITE
ncbi:NACHT, LRR and PYD domains-containing protein 3-like [Hypanus sabinus]|uniref:NACHT, LRR and PYD domains-containing protein 3-like n=1 Tax=Hypanus sabinus TaxID=79690 RepID=UPI0028C3D1AA|nr:NACHT, LRR and PYD domains-containing protein 3-like [Hypanus sabinus]